MNGVEIVLPFRRLQAYFRDQLAELMVNVDPLAHPVIRKEVLLARCAKLAA